MVQFYLKEMLKNIFFNPKVQNFTIFKNRGTGTTYIRVPEKCTSYILKRLFYRYKYHKQIYFNLCNSTRCKKTIHKYLLRLTVGIIFEWDSKIDQNQAKLAKKWHKNLPKCLVGTLMIGIPWGQMYNRKNVTLFEKINAFLWKL